MAAHGLTIARQLLAQADGDPDAFLAQCRYALNAPGLDLGASDPTRSRFSFHGVEMDAYGHLYHGAQGVVHCGIPQDLDTRRNRCVLALQEMVRALAFLDGYASLEDATMAYRAYVRFGAPYWHRRIKQWHDGCKRAHMTARPGAAPVVAGYAP